MIRSIVLPPVPGVVRIFIFLSLFGGGGRRSSLGGGSSGSYSVFTFAAFAAAAAATDKSDSNNNVDCGLWLGPSIIKQEAEHGFGFGMYTGRKIPKGTKMNHEVLVPMFDYGDDHHPPLREYFWTAEPLHELVLESYDSTLIFLPGLSSIAPCTSNNFNLEQVHDLKYNDYNMQRSLTNATAGSFSYYTDSMFTAIRDILPGEELVVECTDDDFDPADYPKQPFDPNDPTMICLDDKVEERTTTMTEEEGGTIVPGKGLFAKKELNKNTVLLSTPMTPVHRNELLMDDEEKEEGEEDEDSNNNKNNKDMRKQLLLNYCYGHEDSALLWLPHGPLVNSINHSSENPNAKIRWHTGGNDAADKDGDKKQKNKSTKIDYQLLNADLARRQQFHHPELLESYFEAVANVHGKGLVMDIVAIRDIDADEEIRIDYGESWSKAWKEHVSNWQKQLKEEKWDDPIFYVNVQKFNEENQKTDIRTITEQHRKPYPKNVQTACYFGVDWVEDDWADDEDVDVLTYESWNNQQDDKFCILPCHILDRIKDEGTGEISYTAKLVDTHTDNISIEWDCHLYKRFEYIYEDIPREGITFLEKTHKSDVWLHEAFRHEIGMPDEMYPDIWKKQRRVRRRYMNGTSIESEEDGDAFKRKSVSTKQNALEAIRLKKQIPARMEL